MVGIRIDWTLLEQAFESHVPDARTWLHRGTGDIVTSATKPDAGERPESADVVWVEVEPMPSREQYRMMERFIETVVEEQLKTRLQDAIVGKGAFRRFKDVLGHFPEERKRWFAFRDVLLHCHIVEWLKEKRIELLEMPAWTLDLPDRPADSRVGSVASLSSRADADNKAALESVRNYLLAWARAHAAEHSYLFGPAAFEQLALDLVHEFVMQRKRSPDGIDVDTSTDAGTTLRQDVA